MDNPLLIIIAVGAVAVLAIGYTLIEKKRRELLAKFAQENGYEFFPYGEPSGKQPGKFLGSMPDAGDSSWIRQFKGFDPFDHGSSRSSKNLFVKKSDGRTLYLFDYSYSSGSSKSRTTSRYWIAAVELGAELPSLRIRPESIFDRVGSAFGMTDIQIDSPDFDRKYNVSGPDEAFAREVVSPRMIEFLMHAPESDWQIGGKFLLVAHNGRLKPEKIGDAERQLGRFVEQLPSAALQGRSSD